MPTITRHIERKKFIRRSDVRDNDHALFIFGDNAQRIGYGGQAKEMRDEPNAFGIATKESPSRCWTDATLKRNCFIIDEDIQKIILKAHHFDYIVFPHDGIGTGLARLRETAPQTYTHLEASLLNYLGIHNTIP